MNTGVFRLSKFFCCCFFFYEYIYSTDAVVQCLICFPGCWLDMCPVHAG